MQSFEYNCGVIGVQRMREGRHSCVCLFWYQEGSLEGIQMKKKVMALLMFALLLTGCSAGGGSGQKENGRLQMEYYYYPTCEGCMDGEGFAAYVQELLSDVLDPEQYDIVLKNVAEENVYEEFEEIIEHYQTDDFYPTPPVMKVGDNCLFGLPEIEGKIKRTAIEAYNDTVTEEQIRADMEEIPQEDSYFVYFYKEDCSYCREAEEYFASVEKEQMLSDGSMSRLHFTYVDIGDMDNMPIANEFYKKYNVPEEEWKAPMIFWKGGYIMGAEKIKEQFLDIVRGEEATGWPGIESVPEPVK